MLSSIGQLVVVAAPSCCGKTVFLAHLTRDAIPDIAAKIGFRHSDQWEICDAVRLPLIQTKHIDRLIVAYAIPAFELLSDASFDPEQDRRLGIVQLANEVTFVTLLASSTAMTARLLGRHRADLKWLLFDPRRYLRIRRRFKNLLPIYRDPRKLEKVYAWWFDYTTQVAPAGAWAVNANREYVMRGLSKKTKSTPNRGTWVENADAEYTIKEASDWRSIFTEMSSGQLAPGD